MKLEKLIRGPYKDEICTTNLKSEGGFELFEPCTHTHTLYIYIGVMGRVFANGPGDLRSFSGRFIPKTLKMALDTSLLNTQ